MSVEIATRELRATILSPVVVTSSIGTCDYCGDSLARTIRGREHLGRMCSSCTSDYFESFQRKGWTKVEPEKGDTG